MKRFFTPLVWVIVFTLCFPPSLFSQGRGMIGRDSEDSAGSFRTQNSDDDPTSILNQQDTGLGDLKRQDGSTGSSSTSRDSTVLYQVHVLGEVNKPGTYRVPASTRLSEALKLSGGILKNGSERNIELRRSNQKGKNIDLIAYKLFGRLEQNPYLIDNDVVYVPLKKNVIQVEGAVLRSGVYELKGEKNLYEAIRLGGGFSQGASHEDPVRVIRYENEKKEVVEVKNDVEELRSFALRNGDVVIVSHLFTKDNKFDYNLKKLPSDHVFYPSFEDRVFVIGAVNAPGAYRFSPYYKLSSYLAFAGGMNRMSKKKVVVMDGEGTSVKSNPDSNIVINPGDTIYIPEKTLSRETWISILSTVVSLGLTTTAIIDNHNARSNKE